MIIRRRFAPSFFATAAASAVFIIQPQQLPQHRFIAGLKTPTSISPQEIRVCDLNEIMSNYEKHVAEKKTEPFEIKSNYVSLELQRRMRRIERLVKGAPYAGGPFIQPVITEAREDMQALEKFVHTFSKELGSEYVEKFDEKIEQLRDDLKEIEYDADLI